jgi:hypothetical protein
MARKPEPEVPAVSNGLVKIVRRAGMRPWLLRNVGQPMPYWPVRHQARSPAEVDERRLPGNGCGRLPRPKCLYGVRMTPNWRKPAS